MEVTPDNSTWIESLSEPTWLVSLGLACIGGLVVTIAFIMLMVQGFRVGVWWGVLVFLPILGVFIFSFAKWGRAKGPFLLHTVGLVVGLAGVVSLGNKLRWEDVSPGLESEPASGVEQTTPEDASVQSLPKDIAWA